MGSGLTFGAPPLLARAHHGSVSKEQRALVEDDLKSGRLKAVVATSSLELGIDMGAVDLVIQVEAPPSVASGLQRIGRAGHQVGEISQGVLFPKHRTDLIGCAVTVRRMLAGQIETMRVPANPLDVLAQHTVAACALEPLDADRWFDTVRRSAPFATLPRSAFEATLDLLSGKYPSTEFAELRPRLVYDRDAGTLTARPGAQRLAVTSGGAIPDRGLFTVYLAIRLRKAFAGRRTRRGDGLRVAARRRDLAGRDQLADHRDHPRPGAGDPRARSARPAAVLARRRRGPARRTRRRDRRVHRRAGRPRPRRLRQALRRNGFRRLRDRQPVAAAGRPAHRHRDGADRHHLGGRAVPRRARRLAGDPALPVRASGARAAGAGGGPTAARALRHRREADRLRRRHHRAAARHRARRRPTGRRLFVFDADEIEPIVTAEVGGSALFASRFRECAARALLLPRRHPGKRLAAVASAAARGAAARRGPQIPGLPDRAGDRSANACRTSTTCRR